MNILKIFSLIKERIEKVFKKMDKDYVTFNNGYYTVNWNNLKNNDNIKKVIEELSTNDKRKEFEDEFKEEWFRHIYFRNIYTVLIIANQIHADKNLLEEDKNRIKRIITVSGIMFGFKIPEKLLLIDETALMLAVKYSIVTSKLKVDDIQVTVIPSSEEEKYNFVNLLIHLPIVMLMVSKNIGLNRSPNVLVLCDTFKKTYPNTWDGMGKDIKNFKRLLTICYGVSGVYIPRDYCEIDDCVIKYLLGETIEIIKQKKSHLKLV